VEFSLFKILTNTPVWATAVSGAFSVSRGLAIAILLSGLSLAQTISPILARMLIDGYGWRGAYVGLALGWGGFTLLLAWLFFHDTFGKRARSVPGGTVQLLPGGLTLPQALRDSRMQRITFAICVQAVMGAAAMSHLVPILEWSGTSRANAAAIAALLGIASISGKLVVGWLADLVRRSFLPAACFALPGLGYLLLLQGAGSSLLLSAGVFIVGFGSGAAYHMTTFLTVQYSGLQHNGKIFGALVGMLGLGGGIGPLIAGILFDLTDSYYHLLMAGLPLALIAGAALLTLGPYPVFEPVQPRDTKPVPEDPAPA
jgi:predicted MFS family arabinose efflux permease